MWPLAATSGELTLQEKNGENSMTYPLMVQTLHVNFVEAAKAPSTWRISRLRDMLGRHVCHAISAEEGIKMTSYDLNSDGEGIDRRYKKNDPETTAQPRKKIFIKRKNMPRMFLLLFLITGLMSCGVDSSVDDQAKEFITSVQNLDIDRCVLMSNLYQTKLAGIENEPQFRIGKLADDISNEIRRTILNQYDNDNIIYVFRFPCKWKILESKKISQETTSSIIPGIVDYYRVFVLIKYNSIDNSPISVPLINKDFKSQYNIKEIILHCDFDPETKLYLGWGLDSHTRW